MAIYTKGGSTDTWTFSGNVAVGGTMATTGAQTQSTTFTITPATDVTALVLGKASATRALGIDVGVATGTITTGIGFTGTVTTGIDVSPTLGTTGISLGLTGVTYTTGIALGVTGGTLTTGISVVGAMTTGINFTSAAAIGTLVNATGACAALATRGIFIGEDSNSIGKGIALNGASWATSQGNALYTDDGGVAATGYTESFTVRHLTTTTVASGDVSFTAIHPDMYLNASYTGSGGISSIWGNTTIATDKAIDTSGGLGDVGGASFGLDVVGTLAASSHGCGVSVGLGGSGTKSGIMSGFRVRTPTGTVLWDAFLSLPSDVTTLAALSTAGSGKTPSLGTAGPTGSDSAPTYWLNIYIGTAKYYFPVWAAT